MVWSLECRAGSKKYKQLKDLFENEPVPDVHDIPLAYRTYASGLLLGIFGTCEGEDEERHGRGTVTRREVRAAGGIRGLYSYARRQDGTNKRRWLRMAQLREMSYGCRSYVLGVLLQCGIWHQGSSCVCTRRITRDEFELNCALPFAQYIEPTEVKED